MMALTKIWETKLTLMTLTLILIFYTLLISAA